MDSLVGKHAGEYRLLARIGQGGMSVVYRGQRPGSETALAIKVLSPIAAETGTFSRRFQREAAVLKRLRHPNIVPVIDFGEIEGRPFLVMPLVEGGSLGDRLDKGATSPREGGRILDQVADGLAYAHGQGVVHRDIKPSNILLDGQGNAQLADFGLALVHDASISLTGSALIGTPSYMSPEQARGAPVDARTDQYSLGIVLYEMTTGRLPFVADTPMAVVVKHMQEPLPLPRTVNPNVPLAIERVILKATAKDPEDRFPDVLAMNEAFQTALAHTLRPSGAAPALIPVPPSAQGVTLPLARQSQAQPSWWSRRRMGFAGALAVLAVLLCLAGGAAAYRIIGGTAALSPDPSAGAQAGLQATIEALTTALAMQETEGPEDLALLADLQASLTALPGRAGGSKELDTATPDPLGTATDVPVTLQAAGASGTPALLLPTSTQRTPTRTPTRTPVASLTRTRTPIATNLTSASPSPSNAPVSPVPSASQTSTAPAPSATRTATASPPPPTATSAPPTSTRTPEPPPPQDLCENIELLNPKVDLFTARIDVRNRNDAPVEITALWLDWPEDRGRLDRIRFKSNTIWDRGDNNPPTSIDPSEWRSGRSRSISAGGKETLTFIFSWGSSSDDYALEITFDGSCEVDL